MYNFLPCSFYYAAISELIFLCRGVFLATVWHNYSLCSVFDAAISKLIFSYRGVSIPGLLGKSTWKSVEFCNYSNSGPFELLNFHQNFIFPIVKCVPADLEHVPVGSESSPTIDSFDFMNQKMFPLYLSVVSGIKFLDSTHQLFLRTPSLAHCSQYLPNTHKFMKTLLTYQGIGIVVEY
jgi:hypothetical protein